METKKSQGVLSETGQWFFLDYYTYLLFSEGYNASSLQAKMPDFIERNIGDAQRSANQTYEFEFQNIKDIHLHFHLDAESKENGDIQYEDSRDKNGEIVSKEDFDKIREEKMEERKKMWGGAGKRKF